MGVHGEDLVRDYKRDRENANRMYDGKVVTFFEPIANIGFGSQDEAPYLDLETYYFDPLTDITRWPTKIRCYFSPSQAFQAPYMHLITEWGDKENIRLDPDSSGIIPQLQGLVTEGQNRNPYVIEVLGCRFTMARLILD